MKNPASSFNEFGHAILPAAFSHSLTEQLSSLLFKRYQNGEFEACGLCPGSYWIYEEAGMQMVHDEIANSLGRHIGLRLAKSYSCARYYQKGSALKIHRDRDASEISMSLTLASSSSSPWTLYLADSDPKIALPDCQINKINLKIGDAVIFRGPKLYHWRDKLEADWQLQAFFFFVDLDGPYAAHAGDMINKYKNAS